MELSLLSYYLPPRAEKRQKIQARWRSVIYTMSGRNSFSDTHTIRSAAYTVTAERPPRWRRHPPQSLPPAGLKEQTSVQARASSFGPLTEAWTLRPLLAPGDPRRHLDRPKRRSRFPPQSPASGEASSQSTALSHRRRHGDTSPSTAHARAQGAGLPWQDGGQRLAAGRCRGQHRGEAYFQSRPERGQAEGARALPRLVSGGAEHW